MPRQKNIKSTSIYWLYDIRPEVVASERPEGEPFYCGKTVRSLKSRLYGHRQKPSGDAGRRIIECGKHIRMHVIEIVPAGQDWEARERFWIYTGRLLYPGKFLNVTDGGEGAPGWVPNAEQRAKLSARQLGKTRSPETREKMGASKRGKPLSPDHRAKLRIAKIGKTLSPETRAKVSASTRGRVKSAETRAKMSIVAKNRPAETYVKLSEALRAKRAARRTHLPL